MKKIHLLWIIAVSCFTLAAPAAEFALNAVYGSHMVLQRGKPILLAGRANPGEKVEVEFDGKTLVAQTDLRGKWELIFPAKEAGGPWKILCRCGEKVIVLEDVLIGEVWFCSGQSNMAFPVWSKAAGWREREGDRLAREGADDGLRLFNVNLAPSFDKPAEEPRGQWSVAKEGTIAPFSALGFHFGQELRKRLNVPVGLISCAWGGTRIETWITEEGYRNAGLKEELSQIERWRAAPDPGTFFAKELKDQMVWEEKFYAANADKIQQAQKWISPDFDDSSWQSVNVPGYGPLESTLDGVVCYRRTVEIKPAWAGKDLLLSLGRVDDADHTYFNGELIGATGMDKVGCQEVKRLYRVPGRLVKAGKAVIVVRVADFSDRGGILGPKEEIMLKVDGSLTKKIMLAGSWKCAVEFRHAGTIGPRPPVVKAPNQQFPASLARGGVAPWFRYPVRGVIWYQGESNTGRVHLPHYAARFQILIRDWRRAWNDPEMPFLFVQLASFLDQRGRPFSDEELKKRKPVQYSNWALLREAQSDALQLPATGMAVAIDQGDPADIHPADKRVVAARLAAEAARLSYGETGVTHGPMFDKVRFEKGKAILSFRDLGGGLVVKGEKINAFSLCGKNGIYVAADAELKGNEIIVSSDKVKEPVAVRYAWDNCPYQPNVFNREGYPLVPFRTNRREF